MSNGIRSLSRYQQGGPVPDKLRSLWEGIRGRADDPSLGYIGASMLPGVGEVTDLVEIGAGLQDRSLGRIGLGITALALPFVGAAGLRKLFKGLPMDEASRMKRAKKMGFDTTVFHGTYVDPKNSLGKTVKYKGGAEDWISLEPSDTGMMGPGIYAGTPEVASGYAKWEIPKHQYGRRSYMAGRLGGSRVYPLMVRGKKLLHVDFSPTSEYTKIKNKLAKKLSRKEFLDVGLDPNARSLPNDLASAPWRAGARQSMSHLSHKLAKAIEKAGYEGVYMGSLGVNANVAIFDPKNIRSTWAKFDPKKRHSRDLLAGIAGLAAFRQTSNALREDLEGA